MPAAESGAVVVVVVAVVGEILREEQERIAALVVGECRTQTVAIMN